MSLADLKMNSDIQVFYQVISFVSSGFLFITSIAIMFKKNLTDYYLRRTFYIFLFNLACQIGMSVYSFLALINVDEETVTQDEMLLLFIEIDTFQFIMPHYLANMVAMSLLFSQYTFFVSLKNFFFPKQIVRDKYRNPVRLEILTRVKFYAAEAI